MNIVKNNPDNNKTIFVRCIEVQEIEQSEGIIEYISRQSGSFDYFLYQKIITAANEYKEGDAIIGTVAKNEESRTRAKKLLINTKVKDIMKNPLCKPGTSLAAF